jgi:CelD/BcsL family acetyltransferase involved in cellulose biosynthesis
MTNVEQTSDLAPQMIDGDIQIRVLAHPDGARKTWSTLEADAAATFFRSWSWIGAWLATIPADVQPFLVTWAPHGRLCAAAIWAMRSRWRSRIIRVRGLHLLQTGRPELDMVTIEHNGIVARRGMELEATEAILTALLRQRSGWDDLVVSGLDSEALPSYQQAARKLGLTCSVQQTRPCFMVDLARLRAEKRDYLSVLSSNTRYQVRRAVRAYEELGKLEVREAQTPAEALEFFHALGRLHQAYWTAKGEPGAFASPYFVRLHETIIRDSQGTGAAQLLRVRAGAEDVGYLYNVLGADVVYSYQSGFVYTTNPHLKPGLVSHYSAILYNLEHDRACYDLLAGDSQYKRSLATNEGSMVWITLERPRLRFALERRLRGALGRKS